MENLFSIGELDTIVTISFIIAPEDPVSKEVIS